MFKLQAALGKVNRTGNQDIVEGLFDGLMQVMVCGVSINVLDTLPNSTTTCINDIGNLKRILSCIKAFKTTGQNIFLNCLG